MAEGYAEDAQVVPNRDPVLPPTDNKYDGVTGPASDPDMEQQMALYTGENDFPRQTGHDSLTDEEAQLS